MVEHLFIISIILYLVVPICLMLVQVANGRKLHIFVFAAIASCFGIATAVTVLFSGSTIRLDFQLFLPTIIKYNFLLDSLSSYFILAISVISFVASIYSIGYTRLYVNKRDVRFLGFTYNLFLMAMLLVVSANNAFVFMIVWELMTLVSFFLVIFEHENPTTRKAGLVYIVMAHIGSGLLAIAFFILLAYGGSFSFDSFRMLLHRYLRFIKILCSF